VTENKAAVAIVYGSPTDEDLVVACGKVLDYFGVAYESAQLSAHRDPVGTASYADGAEGRGIKVLIGIAGMAAHLAGALAARSTLPVVGVPAKGPALDGLDALLSTVQMPAGVPVATVAIGSAGAKNAALLAVQMIAIGDGELAGKLRKFKAEQARKKVL
jgi:phosphoribosylaminoimidazole carboxylase PurE protein